MIEKEPGFQREKEELEIVIEEGRGEVQFLIVPELRKRVPIYNFRNLVHHIPIAKALADGKRMAMFGGVWGAFKGIKKNTTTEDFFHRQVKPGRPWEAKVPLMTRPEDGVRLVDWSKVHGGFRFLSDYWKFKKLWTSHPSFVHIIAPVRSTKYSLPNIFITTPEEYTNRYKGVDNISVSTIAVIYRADPYLDHLSALMKRFAHTDMYLGVSTLNPHGEEPPYGEEELFEDIRTGRCRIEAIDLLVRDRVYEKTGAFGSHTQIRLPLIGEKPIFKIVRIGSFSKEGFETATGFKCEIIPGAKDVRKNPGENLDERLAKMMVEINERWRTEKPQIFFRT
jgi:hypothetical protein